MPDHRCWPRQTTAIATPVSAAFKLAAATDLQPSSGESSVYPRSIYCAVHPGQSPQAEVDRHWQASSSGSSVQAATASDYRSSHPVSRSKSTATSSTPDQRYRPPRFPPRSVASRCRPPVAQSRGESPTLQSQIIDHDATRTDYNPSESTVSPRLLTNTQCKPLPTSNLLPTSRRLPTFRLRSVAAGWRKPWSTARPPALSH